MPPTAAPFRQPPASAGRAAPIAETASSPAANIITFFTIRPPGSGRECARCCNNAAFHGEVHALVIAYQAMRLLSFVTAAPGAVSIGQRSTALTAAAAREV